MSFPLTAQGRTVVDIADSPRVAPKLLQRLQKAGKAQLVTLVEVDEGKTALVSIDGRLRERLEAGVTGYWNPGRKIGAKLVDDNDEVMLITTGGVLIRTRVAEIRGMGRATQGVTLISLDDGEKLAGLEKIVETVGEIEAEVTADVVADVVADVTGEPAADDAAGEAAGEE